MQSLLDYVALRKDIPCEMRAFNSVDLLVLTELAYVDWEGVLDQESYTICEACQKYTKLHEHDDETKRYIYSVAIPKLVKALQDCPRYAQIKMKAYQVYYSEEEKIQFGALTFVMPDASLVFSFRGTDGSMTGWKENLMMTYADHLPCQKMASQYVKDQIEKIPLTKSLFGLRQRKEIPSICLTGHSKGGNLAMYAGLMNPQLDPYIKKVISFDGPGFSQEFYDEQKENPILNKITTILPKESIIGRLFEHPEKQVIIDAWEHGLFQHDPFHWAVGTQDFLPHAKFTNQGDENLAYVDRMLLSKTKEEKQFYTDLIFSLTDQMEIQCVADLANINIKNGLTGLKSLTKMNNEERKFLIDVISFLRAQTASIFKNKIIEKL